MAKGGISGTPTSAANRWAQNLGSSTTKIQEGVQRVTTAPGAKAAAQKQKYIANVTARADKWATRVAAVSLPDWQNSIINKGLPRIAQGAQAAQPKMEQFMNQLYPYIATQQAKIRSMPSATLNDNIQRMVTFVTGMSQFQYKK